MRLFDRAQSYRAVFLQPDGTPNPPGKAVLKHLAAFCRANKPTAMFAFGRMDALASARMDGRREVFLLINEFLHLSESQILQLEQQSDD